MFYLFSFKKNIISLFNLLSFSVREETEFKHERQENYLLSKDF